MNALLPLILAAALLQPAATCDPPGPDDGQAPLCPGELYRYRPLSAAEQSDLRQAMEHCAAVELRCEWLEGLAPVSTWQLRLTRGPQLDPILARAAAVPTWYRPWLMRAVIVLPPRRQSLSFYDAEGQLLLRIEDALAVPGLEREPVSIFSLFPFPDTP